MTDSNVPMPATSTITPRIEKLLPIVCVLLFSVFLVLTSNAKLSGEDDLFWHLSTARYIIDNAEIPSTDVFSYMTYGKTWIPFEWGWDILAYFVYKIDRFVSLAFFSTCLILLTYFLLYRSLKTSGVSLSLSVLCLTILTLGLMVRFTVKPHLVSYLFLSLVLSILIGYKYVSPHKVKNLFFLPLIFILWANIHMGVLAGIALLSVFTASEVVIFRMRNKLSSFPADISSPSRLRVVLLIYILSLGACLVNPHGLETYSYVISHLKLKQMEVVYEWLSPFTSAYVFRSYNIIYYLYLAASPLVVYYSFCSRDIFPLLVYGVFLYHSTTSVRFTSDFLVTGTFFLVTSVDFVMKKSSALKKVEELINRKLFFKVFLCLVLVLLIASVPGSRLYSFLGYQRIAGIGVDFDNFPSKMIEFMKQTQIADIGERPFNSYETGGYFIWNFPGKKNFIDSRGVNDEVWERYVSVINTQPGFLQILDNLKPDYFMWFVPDVNYSRDPGFLNYGILSYLFNSPQEWKLVYWDDMSLLFVRNSEKFTPIIEHYQYNYVTPFNFYYKRNYLDSAAAVNRNAVIREISRHQVYDPAGRLIDRIRSLYAIDTN